MENNALQTEELLWWPQAVISQSSQKDEFKTVAVFYENLHENPPE